MGFNGKTAKYTVKIDLRIEPELSESIERYSARLSQKTSDFVRSAIVFYIRHIREVQHIPSEFNKLISNKIPPKSSRITRKNVLNK